MSQKKNRPELLVVVEKEKLQFKLQLVKGDSVQVAIVGHYNGFSEFQLSPGEALEFSVRPAWTRREKRAG
jgi:hypothetical protein